MSNQVFSDALVQLKAVFATIENEVARQGELEARISAVKASLLNLEGLEREARERLSRIEGDVQLAQKKYSEAQQTAQQILTDARVKAAEIREQALAAAEADAARITEAALDEARQAVRRKRETRTGG